MRQLNIAIAGLGTVGRGVFKILTENTDMIERRAGCKINVVAVSSRNKAYDRGIDVSDCIWYDDAREMANDGNIDVIIELIGGSHGVANDLCRNSLEAGKSVVTANKALIATHGVRLASIAEANNVSLCFEAAVAGGIPVLKNIREGLSANNFTKISGILNGTCNYILTEMESGNRDFDDVLAEAQEKGYAETPPDLDIDGIDTAHKLAIITSLAYGVAVDFDSVYTQGIRDISLDDIKYAAELGYNIKLLGITNITKNGQLEQRVHPCLIAKSAPIGNVDGVLNAVAVECDSFGSGLMTGAGAGEKPTASSVVADIIDIAANRASKPFGIAVNELIKKEFANIDDHEGRYYVRLKVKDEAGVLASITSLFSDEDIGVDSVLQKSGDGKSAQIALTTHATFESSIKKILKNIGNMDYNLEKPHMIRIEEV